MNKSVALDEVTLVLEDGSTFEDVISQLQPSVDNAILCVKDGCELLIHLDRSEFPIFIKLESKNNEIYNFRDPTTDNHYSVFGEEAAGIFCPSLGICNGEKIASLTQEGITATVYGEGSMAKLSETEIKLD